MEIYDTPLNRKYAIRTEYEPESGDIKFMLIFAEDNGKENIEVADDSWGINLVELVAYYSDNKTHVEDVFLTQSILIKITAWLASIEPASTCTGEPDWDDLAKDRRIERGAV